LEKGGGFEKYKRVSERIQRKDKYKSEKVRKFRCGRRKRL